MKTSLSLHPGFVRVAKQLSPWEAKAQKDFRELAAHGLTVDAINLRIAAAIEGEGGFFLGRPGGTESEGLAHFVRSRLSPALHRAKQPYPAFFKKHAQPYSGIAWREETDLDEFNYRYLEAALAADCLGFGRFAPGSLGISRVRASMGLAIVESSFYEPWKALDSDITPWTLSLEGLNVLVIHPFEKTIQKQFERREHIQGVKDIMPSFRLQTLSPPVTVQPDKSGRSWASFSRDLEAQVLSRDFDVAIVGAGSYGLPLSHRIAQTGRKAIHMAGSTQLLFGIAGKRWESNPMVAHFMDSSWTKPLPADVAPGTERIEGGSYT